MWALKKQQIIIHSDSSQVLCNQQNLHMLFCLLLLSLLYHLLPPSLPPSYYNLQKIGGTQPNLNQEPVSFVLL